MKKQILLILIFTVRTIFSIAQSKPADIKELNIGDKCPNFIFENIVRSNRKKIELSELKGKVVVLDFWATWCGSCIGSMKHLDSLRRSLQDKLVVLPVTYEDSTLVKSFISGNKILSSVNFPFITGDKSLRDYFPHRLLPHDVIIDTSGLVIAITTPEQITAKTISQIYSSELADIQKKKDILDFDLDKPLLVGGLGTNYSLDPSKLLFSTMLTNYIPGLPGSVKPPYVIGDKAVFKITNLDIEKLYQFIFGTKNKPLTGSDNPEFYLRFPARTLWEAQHSPLYYSPKKSRVEWEMTPDDEKLFCFEIILPKKDSLNLNGYALQELNRYLGKLYGINGFKEKRMMNYWALTRTTTDDKIQSRGGKPVMDFNEGKNTLTVKNYKLKDFIFQYLSFYMYRYHTPIVDETEYNLPVDLTLQGNPADIVSMNLALKKYGLQFRMVEKPLDMIVIKDIKTESQ